MKVSRPILHLETSFYIHTDQQLSIVSSNISYGGSIGSTFRLCVHLSHSEGSVAEGWPRKVRDFSLYTAERPSRCAISIATGALQLRKAFTLLVLLKNFQGSVNIEGNHA